MTPAACRLPAFAAIRAYPRERTHLPHGARWQQEKGGSWGYSAILVKSSLPTA
jgi:hypothetical protein